jgi:single-stranded-DNA-specific exonuclease
MFNCYDGTPPPDRMRVAYELSVNDWQGRESLRLLLTHMEAVG